MLREFQVHELLYPYPSLLRPGAQSCIPAKVKKPPRAPLRAALVTKVTNLHPSVPLRSTLLLPLQEAGRSQLTHCHGRTLVWG